MTCTGRYNMTECRDTFVIAHKHYRYQPAPHLHDSGDWHDAYKSIIHRIMRSDGPADNPIPVPAYPLSGAADHLNLLFEMGSYWEGALFFLCRIMAAPTPLAGLRAIEQAPSRHGLDAQQQLFLAIWDSEAQLDWLKAHLIREDLIDRCVYRASIGTEARDLARLAHESEDADLHWLARFAAEHARDGHRYPNPFFGGANPLHLGLILASRD